MKNTNVFKDKLNIEKEGLEKELADIALFNPQTHQWEAVPDADAVDDIDDNDVADRFEDFEERSSMVRTLQSRLNDLNSALLKIEEGTYGKCEVDGGPIEEARLEANPAARTCKEHMNEIQ